MADRKQDLEVVRKTSRGLEMAHWFPAKNTRHWLPEVLQELGLPRVGKIDYRANSKAEISQSEKTKLARSQC